MAAFEFFGGVPARLVCDNLKTGVIRPDLYDPQINLAYGELAAFYGTLIDPARAGKPKDKPRIERPMPYIRDSFFAGRHFDSMPQMQGEALRWCHRGLRAPQTPRIDGQTPVSVFTAVERDALMPLPPRPFESVIYTLGKVAPDCHVKSGKAFYSVPWRLIGQQVTVRTAGDVVQIFHNDTVVATHVLHLSGRSTNFEHYPPHKIAHTLRSVTLVSHPGRTDRARRGRDRRRTLASECHPPAARHPGDHPATRHLRRCPPRRRVRSRPRRR